jgi:hypothetical protein
MRTKIILTVILLFASVLRLWRLNSVPVSLFGDELDVGYHAYSILQTGKDYYGNAWPIHFHSIAEWRTPLYLYSAVPTVALFGITPLGVRLPAAIFGILSVWVMYLLVKELLSYKETQVSFHPRALMAAALMAVNPWSLQYSRAGFEVTLLLFLLLLGLYFFFRALKYGKWLWLSVFCLALTAWVYSTAKLFTPLLLVFLFFVWRKDILGLSRKYLLFAALALFIVGAPIAVSTIWGGGSQRFGYISVFTDPTTETEVGTDRQNDARVRGETGTGLAPTILDRVIHNKYTFWGENVVSNYFRAFSTDFLFVRGDINLRHSIGTGEFYKIEIVTLIAGLVFFFIGKRDIKVKLLIIFWILVGAVPAAFTRDGGNHATRLILILPPLIFLISYGAKEILNRSKLFSLILIGIWLLGFGSYIHRYYVHYPWESERWWHAGWSESIKAIKEVEGNYDNVVISMAGEPAWIFFAGNYMYSPSEWQRNFPIGNDVNLEGFGKVSHVGKFYFGSPSGGLYEWGKVLNDKTLYLANASEVGVNLFLEPDRKPGDLDLIKAIAYPSGEPAFYLFAGK